MIQKRSCSLSTKVNRTFNKNSKLIKIRVIIMENVYIFTKYETVFENVITILPVIYQNKTKMPQKNRNCLAYLLEVANYINYMQAI